MPGLFRRMARAMVQVHLQREMGRAHWPEPHQELALKRWSSLQREMIRCLSPLELSVAWRLLAYPQAMGWARCLEKEEWIVEKGRKDWC